MDKIYRSIDKAGAYLFSIEGIFLWGCIFSIIFHKALNQDSMPLFLFCFVYWSIFFFSRTLLKSLFKKLIAWIR